MLSSPRPRLVSLALGGLALLCALYAGHAILGFGSSALFERWIYELVMAGSAALCLARGVLVRQDRGAWLALGAALTLYAAGDLYWNAQLADLEDPPYPSLADAGWLAYYLPAYLAIGLLLRARVGRLRPSQWLDGLIGVLAIAALAVATVLDPVLGVSGNTAEVATNLAYPVGDLALLIVTLAAVVLVGRRPGRAWIALVAGLALFAVCDSAYLLQVAAGTYAEGGLVDAGWPIAATLLALAAWQPMAPARERPVSFAAEQAVTAGFALLALGVLALDLVQPVNTAAHVLALVAMVAIVARLGLAARESRGLEQARSVEANTDELTGLANRRSFYAHLDRRLAALTVTGESAALLLLDLDHFKEFNDSLGHGAGDDLLSEVARRLRACVPAATFIARLGGDEFVVLLPDGSGEQQAADAAHAVQQALAEPVELAGLACHASASVGIAVAPEHGLDRTTLLRRADIAMYRAKHGATAVELFDDVEDDASRGHLELAGELRHALAHDELVLHYQPKAHLASGAVDCVEALVRWQHPRLGLLAPDAFLPVAERHGLMRRVTAVVLEQALRQQADWRRRGIDLTVAVNLAAADLLDVRFPEEVAALLERIGTPRGALQLEITENTVMVDPERVLATLARLGDLGVTFALDDYGTGHSSLTYLKRLPVRELKIDRSFVTDLAAAHDNAVIVRSTIGLARSLGMRVVAEGVESAEDWQQLSEFGCDVAQGFYLGRPMPAGELAAWLDPALRARRPA